MTGSGVIFTNQDTTIDTSLLNGETVKNSLNADARSAVEYYAKAYLFSEWLYSSSLNGLLASDITSSGTVSFTDENKGDVGDINSETKLKDNIISPFDDSLVFQSGDPEDEESNFYNHKRKVIKNSINYNLALAMVTYSQMTTMKEYDMPIFSETDWDKILNNVSVVTFMQGLQCGLKYYNGYAIATSVNNEITVSTNEIYYVGVTTEDGTSPLTGADNTVYTDLTDDYYLNGETAHRLDCRELRDFDSYISFKSKEIKYDKIYSKELGRYIYDHKALNDYDCIVNSNYYITDGTNRTNGNGNLHSLLTTSYLSDAKKRAYRMAVGKERNNLYKALDYDTNYGYEITNYTDDTAKSSFDGLTCGTRTAANEIYRIEITIEDTKNSTRNVYTDTMTITIGGQTYTAVIPTTSRATRTIELNVSNLSNNSMSIRFERGSTTILKSIKVYYK